MQSIKQEKGVQVALNALTGGMTTKLANSVVAPGGTIIMFGGIGGLPTDLPFPSLITKGISIQGYTLYELTYDKKNLPALIDYVREGIEAGDFTPNVDIVFGFRDIAAAREYMTVGNTQGAVVLKVSS